MGALKRTHHQTAAWGPAVVIWETPEVGDAVRLQKQGWPPLDGYVEDRTPEGDNVWVVRVGERRLFHRADGYNLTVLK
jgi:hypothetical protein